MNTMPVKDVTNAENPINILPVNDDAGAAKPMIVPPDDLVKPPLKDQIKMSSGSRIGRRLYRIRKPNRKNKPYLLFNIDFSKRQLV